MSRPNNITDYAEMDLKLGIKSSLPNVKSTVALAILIWECVGHPSTIKYSVQNDNAIVIAPEVERTIIEHLSEICTEEQISHTELISKINSNQLFKSQMEALMVAFELVWKIAKVSFVDRTKNASAERKGGIRYPKQLLYSVNIDIIHSAICTNEKEYIKVLLSWIGIQVSYSTECESALLHMLTALSESAIFKLSAEKQDIIFCQNGIYQQLLENTDAVNIDDVKEAKGSLRILKSLLSDGMNPYLQGSGRNVIANPNEDLVNYQARVDTFLRLSSTKVINNEPEEISVFDSSKQKTKFRNWLESQVKPEGDSEAGQPYSKNTIDQYVSNVENTFLSNGKSLFSTYDVETANKCAIDLNASVKKNNTQRSAVQKYILFLKETNATIQNLVFKTNYISSSGFEHNRILFGAPGTGKSYTLNSDKDRLLTNGGNYERVTFHPDYSYANFVGTYKPVPSSDNDGNETITYEYVPGPFMRILVKALKSAMSEDVKPFLLLVEEINRANVAAVFGDVFQLLDRDDDGVSEYSIATSNDMRKFLAKELSVDEEQIAEIKLPNNMFIWATMNSADQGVFPMDTAFKRRWSFEYIGIDAEEEYMPESIKIYLPAKKSTYYVEWNVLRKAINSYLTTNNVNEDKLMGPFFVSNAVMSSNSKDTIVNAIKNKVIMYLFEDAAKRCRGVFGGCSAEERKRYSEICRKFDEDGITIFAKEITDKVKKNEITADSEDE